MEALIKCFFRDSKLRKLKNKTETNLSNRKLMVIDTSVLLYDPHSLKSFTGNDVVIPLIVLEELDRFKDRSTLIGSNARNVNRFLDELREEGSFSKGITIPGTDIVVKCFVDAEVAALPASLDASAGDNKIIAAALAIKNANPNSSVIVVTKDINLRIKCDSLGLLAEDYYKDYSDIGMSSSHGHLMTSGQTSVTLDEDALDDYYRDGEISLNDTQSPQLPLSNQLVVGTTGSGGSMIGIVKGAKIIKPRVRLNSMAKIEPKSKEQTAALHLLTDMDVPLVSLTGIAGSGKTFLALVAGMSGVHEGIYERIVITRSIEPVGKDIGFLPGNIDEKMAPWLLPIVDNFRNAFHDTSYFTMMYEKGKIEVSPITFIRGRSLAKCFIIVDECQNLSIHELKTLITRVGMGSKMVLLGDTDQIDTPYLDKWSNGLTIAIEKLKGQNLFGHIHLDKGVRSPLATLGSNLL